MNKYVILIFCSTVISLLLSTSCTIDKRLYTKGYSINKIPLKVQKRSADIANKEINNNRIDEISKQKVQIDQIESKHLLNCSKSNTDIYSIISLSMELIKDIQADLIIRSEEKCDIIIMKNGDEIKAKISEILVEEIKYKLCDYLDGPSITISKNDVFMIKFANGTKQVIEEYKPNKNDYYSNNNTYQNTQTVNSGQTDGLAVASLVLGILSLITFYGAFIFGILAVIFGEVAGKRIRDSNYEIRGIKMAKAGAICGWISFLLVITLIVILL